ncbi:MAG: HlyC/CorC family transporter [Oscillospiraceae bacterium]|nr:HlyC/CorC family transporter [Oscillospiraceae bacterium]
MDPDGQTILSAANAATEQAGGSSIFLKIVILIVLILLNAFFAMSEIAIITLNDNKLKKQTEEGNKKAIRASKLTADPSRFLATIQIGVTLSGFLASAVAADSFAKMIVNAFSATTISPSLIHSVALILITLILSYFTLVFGELVPKRIAMQYPEKIAFSVSGILLFFSKILRPFVALLAASTNLAVKAFGIDPNQEPEEVTEEEIRMMVDVGNEKGVIEKSQKDMINNIFEFDDKTVEEVMTHRTEIVSVEIGDTIADIMDVAINEGYSRIPVYEETIDNIVGIVYVKDLLKFVNEAAPQNFSIKDYLRPALYVPASNGCKEVFVELKRQKIHMAVAVDEYGGTAGIVTMEDLLEAIVGNIQDEYDEEEEEISKIDENTFTIEGSASLEEIQELFGIEPPNEEADYETLGGMIMDILGRIPGEDEHPSVVVGNVEFTVEKVEDRRIMSVKAKKLSVPDEQ